MFIAGATSTGARVAKSVALSRSSEIPAAYFASSLAVAGATMAIAGAATWLYRPTAHDKGARSTRDFTVVVGDRQLVLAGRF